MKDLHPYGSVLIYSIIAICFLISSTIRGPWWQRPASLALIISAFAGLTFGPWGGVVVSIFVGMSLGIFFDNERETVIGLVVGMLTGVLFGRFNAQGPLEPMLTLLCFSTICVGVEFLLNMGYEPLGDWIRRMRIQAIDRE